MRTAACTVNCPDRVTWALTRACRRPSGGTCCMLDRRHPQPGGAGDLQPDLHGERQPVADGHQQRRVRGAQRVRAGRLQHPHRGAQLGDPPGAAPQRRSPPPARPARPPTSAAAGPGPAVRARRPGRARRRSRAPRPSAGPSISAPVAAHRVGHRADHLAAAGAQRVAHRPGRGVRRRAGRQHLVQRARGQQTGPHQGVDRLSSAVAPAPSAAHWCGGASTTGAPLRSGPERARKASAPMTSWVDSGVRRRPGVLAGHRCRGGADRAQLAAGRPRPGSASGR